MQVMRLVGALLFLAVLVSSVLWLGRDRLDDQAYEAQVRSAEVQSVRAEGVVDHSASSSGGIEINPPSLVPYRERIRQRVEAASKPFRISDAPSMRSATGDQDALQCAPSDADCDAFSPLFARSWDEAQWMRRHGFIDSAQMLAASALSDPELDRRAQFGDPAAVSELAKRFLREGQELEAKQVLMDGVQKGNVFAAHQLAAIDEGRTLPFNKRPGLEWLLVARRMGDTQVSMSYIVGRYPDLQPREIDHSMLVADRLSEQYRLNSRSVELRPAR